MAGQWPRTAAPEAICGPLGHMGTCLDPWPSVRTRFTPRLRPVFLLSTPSTEPADAVTGPRIAYTGKRSSKAAADVRTRLPGRAWRLASHSAQAAFVLS